MKIMKIIKSVLLVVGLFLPCASSPQARQDKQDEPTYAVQLVSFEDIAYPASAKLAKIQGAVVVKVRLDDEGSVVDAFAVSGAKALIPDCLANVKSWKFKPGSGKVAIIVYQFRLVDALCRDDSHSLFLLLRSNFASITACAPGINADFMLHPR